MSLRLRRGGYPGDVPPPPESYGPPGGAEGVRQGAGPRTVSDPGGGIAFTSASDLETKIAANASGSIFVASGAGTWSWPAAGVIVGTKRPRIYFPGVENTFILQGPGGVSEGIFRKTAGSSPSNYELHGGTFKGAGRAWLSYDAGPAGAAIYDVRVTEAYEHGISFNGGTTTTDPAAGSYCTASYCRFDSNGRYGAGGQNVQAITFTHNIVSYNNTRGLNPEDDAGGSKFLGVYQSDLSYNWFYRNNGFGHWHDYDNGELTIDESLFEENRLAGLFYEASQGGTTIQHCMFLNNGAGPDSTVADETTGKSNLYVSCSPCDGTDPSPGIWGAKAVGLDISWNLISSTDTNYWNHNPAHGILVHDHASHPSNKRCRKVYVHDNDIWIYDQPYYNGSVYLGWPGQRNGLVDSTATNAIVGFAADNRWSSNRYHLRRIDATNWHHGYPDYVNSAGDVTWESWRAQLNGSSGTSKDADGLLEVIA